MNKPKVKCEYPMRLNGQPDGTLKSGARLDQLIDALTSAQAAGAPDGSNVLLSDQGRGVTITWEEER